MRYVSRRSRSTSNSKLSSGNPLARALALETQQPEPSLLLLSLPLLEPLPLLAGGSPLALLDVGSPEEPGGPPDDPPSEFELPEGELAEPLLPDPLLPELLLPVEPLWPDDGWLDGGSIPLLPGGLPLDGGADGGPLLGSPDEEPPEDEGAKDDALPPLEVGADPLEAGPLPEGPLLDGAAEEDEPLCEEEAELDDARLLLKPDELSGGPLLTDGAALEEGAELWLELDAEPLDEGVLDDALTEDEPDDAELEEPLLAYDIDDDP